VIIGALDHMIIRNITMIKKVAGIININESKFLALQNKLKFVDHNIKGCLLCLIPLFVCVYVVDR
jgi:hypothetical protein